MKTAYLGIDPGSKSGALCLLAPDSIEFCDINDNILECSDWIQNHLKSYHIQAAIERVHAMPSQGATSGFQFGYGVGALHALLLMNRIPYQLVGPQVWQATVDVIKSPKVKKAKSTKKLSPKQLREAAKKANKAKADRKKLIKHSVFNFCKRQFPHADLVSLNKHSDRADALSIAYWLSKQKE
jgi:hypothetical protein